MALPLRKEEVRFSYADYLTWHDNKRYELIDGIPYCMSPAPNRQHQEISITLAVLIHAFLKDKPCKVYTAPFDVALAEQAHDSNEKITTVVQPDIVVVCDRNKLDDQGCKGAPDLVIEILSPYTASRDIKDKFYLYEKHQVKEYWIVDPSNRIIVVYKLGTDKKFMRAENYGSEDTIEVGILPGLVLDLQEVFAG